MTTTTVAIRPMTHDDIDAVHAIERASASMPWTVGILRDELAQPETRWYAVACDGARVVGFVGLMTIVGEGHITNIAVDPTCRSERLGTRLLLAATRAAIERDCQSLTLEVRVSNTAARSLYARFGYAPAGVRKAYYADNREDALVMWVHDIDAEAYAARLFAIDERLTVGAGAAVGAPSTTEATP